MRRRARIAGPTCKRRNSAMAGRADFAALDQMIATARSMATLAQDAAPIAARYVEAQLKATASAGQAPDGTPWVEKKKGGGRALQHAAEAIRVQAMGTVVLIILTGH